MEANLRASDNDRQLVVEFLQQHTVAGRLSLDEFSSLADAAHRAVTYGDLASLTADLPDEPGHRPLSRGPVSVVLVVAAILTVLLGAGIAAQAGGLTHMDTMMAAMGTSMGGYCH
jgi:Domain of unknown function (DUF1707)